MPLKVNVVAARGRKVISAGITTKDGSNV